MSGAGNAFVVGAFKVTDPRFKTEYAMKVDETIAPMNGRFILRNPVATARYSEGADYTIAVAIEFPDTAAALAWLNSDAYQAIAPVKKATSETKTFAVFEGPAQRAEDEGTSKGYVLGEFAITNPSFKTEYAMRVDETLEPFGGKFLVRNPVATAVYKEETNYSIAVLLEFPSVEKALAWKESDAYQAICPAKKAFAETVTFSIYEYPPVVQNN